MSNVTMPIKSPWVLFYPASINRVQHIGLVFTDVIIIIKILRKNAAYKNIKM